MGLGRSSACVADQCNGRLIGDAVIVGENKSEPTR